MMRNEAIEHGKNGYASNGFVIESELAVNYKICQNLDTEIICVTADKLENILKDYCADVEKKRGYETPLSLIISFFLTFCTATFHDAFGLPAVMWKTFFLVGLIASIVLLVKSCIGIKSINIAQPQKVLLVK